MDAIAIYFCEKVDGAEQWRWGSSLSWSHRPLSGAAIVAGLWHRDGGSIHYDGTGRSQCPALQKHEIQRNQILIVYSLLRSSKIAWGLMLGLHQDGPGLLLVCTGWKGRISGSSTYVAPSSMRGQPTLCFINNGCSLWKRPSLLLLFFFFK